MQKKLTVVSTQQPTIDQFATLNALLRESEFLARQLNQPVTNLFWSSIYSIISSAVLDEKLLLSLLMPVQQVMGTTGLIVACSGFVYVQYKGWQAAATILSKIFPNGIGYSMHTHPAYEMQRKIGSKEEAENYIEELKQLVAQQQSSVTANKYITLIASFVLPLLASIKLTKNSISVDIGSIDILLSKFGPYFSIASGEKLTWFPELVKNLASYQQALLFDQTVYKYWSEYNKPKQLEVFCKRLTRLSCTSYEWEIRLVDPTIKVATLAILNLPSDKVNYKDQDNITHSIPRHNYIVELHRMLLRKTIPVYIVGEDTIVVGYTELSEKRSHVIRRELRERLQVIEIYKNETHIVLKLLSEVNKIIKVQGKWSIHIENDLGVQINANYYFNAALVENFDIVKYQELLKNIVKTENAIVAEGNILTIRYQDIDIEKLKHLNAELKRPPSDESKTTNTSSYFHLMNLSKGISSTKRIIKKDKPAGDEEEQVKHPTNIVSYPEKVTFKNSVTFFKALINEPEKPDNYAYPMHVSWLPEGRIYGYVDPAVFPAVKGFLSKKEILDRLEVGVVHSPAQAEKSKVGSVGIQTEDRPYRNIHGQTFFISGYKLTSDNNTCIYGSQVDVVKREGKDIVLICFDGPSRRH